MATINLVTEKGTEGRVYVSPTDVAELERMLAESSVGAAGDIEQARQSADGLGLFIRSLVGLDRQAAIEAFGEFLDGRNLSRSQIEFIHMIIGHLTKNGVMDEGLLYESPFTDIAPQGPDALFAEVAWVSEQRTGRARAGSGPAGSPAPATGAARTIHSRHQVQSGRADVATPVPNCAPR